MRLLTYRALPSETSIPITTISLFVVMVGYVFSASIWPLMPNPGREHSNVTDCAEHAPQIRSSPVYGNDILNVKALESSLVRPILPKAASELLHQ